MRYVDHIYHYCSLYLSLFRQPAFSYRLAISKGQQHTWWRGFDVDFLDNLSSCFHFQRKKPRGDRAGQNWICSIPNNLRSVSSDKLGNVYLIK